MINVVIADDSAFLRNILKETLEKEGKIKVIGQAKNGKEAVELAKSLKPQVLILDCEMPVMNGLEALRKIMEECPVPVFMFSSLTSAGASVTIKALEYGAVDFLLKPTSLSDGLGELEKTLARKIEIVAIKGKFIALRKSGQNLNASSKPVEKKVAPQNVRVRKIDLIALGSSTGGVQAASVVIPRLSESCPPVVWVQHMPENFTKSLADRLAGLSKMKVKEAEHGDILERGCVYLGRGGTQMRVTKAGLKMKIEFGGPEKVSGFCPSCDVLFESVSLQYGENALGVILTGMGKDGTAGLQLMHKKGSYVIGQDESTCVVYGMPKAAFEAGAVDLQLAIEDIAPVMEKICGVSSLSFSKTI